MKFTTTAARSNSMPCAVMAAMRRVCVIVPAALLVLFSAPCSADAPGPFASLPGWWSGAGRLIFKDGKEEQVKCRATYFVEPDGNDLKQTIRCASGSGKIEVVSNVKHAAGALTGTWTEMIYNMTGELTGEVTPRGFRVSVKAGDTGLSANMEIMVRETKQLIEIQFFSETLLGLTLMLDKGTAGKG